MPTYRKKYPTPPEARDDHYPVGTKNLTTLQDKTLVPKVLPDGTLEVENIRERSSDGLSFHLDTEKDKTYFAKPLDSNTEIRYIPQKVDKVYHTSVSIKEEVSAAFAVYKGEVKRFITKNLDRYKSSPKPLKKKIDDIQKVKNQFIFTNNRNGNQWNQIFIDTTTFGPYNYDVKLEVTKSINFINDLIVVKSGDYSQKYHRSSKGYSTTSNNWNIAWVSPHQTVTHQGEGVYALTGTTLSQTDVAMTGAGAGYLSGVVSYQRDYHVTNAGQCFSLSSRHIEIPAGQNLSSGVNYNNKSTYKKNLQDTDPTMQEFYYAYDEYSGKLNTSGWDGIIPSGRPFAIESWSTNPVYVGFDGEITIKPTSSSAPTCDYNATVSGEASDMDYQQSVRKAIKQAKKKFFKALNKALIAKGIKNKGSRQKRYEKLLERVAQNAYDGLSMVRNEHLQKVQGLENNPLDGPVYYDGTIKEYGGASSTAFYDTEQTYKLRNKVDNTTGGTGASSSSSTSSTY